MQRTHTANVEVQVLEGIVLGEGDTEKTSCPIQSSASGRLVCTVCIYRTPIILRQLAAHKIRTAGKKDEGRSSVNDTSSLGQDRCGAVGDALVDSPVVGCRVGGGERAERIYQSGFILELKQPTCMQCCLCTW
jgi:hypothetical protein